MLAAETRLARGEISIPWRERSYDLLEARIFAQLVPVGMQSEHAIIDRTWNARYAFQLLDGAIVLACPAVNESQVLEQQMTVNCVLAHRNQFDRTLAMFDCLL